jgi:hypothetical protein
MTSNMVEHGLGKKCLQDSDWRVLSAAACCAFHAKIIRFIELYAACTHVCAARAWYTMTPQGVRKDFSVVFNELLWSACSVTGM